MEPVLILIAFGALVISVLVQVFALNIVFKLASWHKQQIELLGQILEMLRRANLTQERSARAVEKVAESAPEEDLDAVLKKRLDGK